MNLKCVSACSIFFSGVLTPTIGVLVSDTTGLGGFKAVVGVAFGMEKIAGSVFVGGISSG